MIDTILYYVGAVVFGAILALSIGEGREGVKVEQVKPVYYQYYAGSVTDVTQYG